MPIVAKRILGVIGIILFVLFVTLGLYLVYLMTSSYRLEDNQALEVKHSEGTSITPTTDKTYSIVSYNVGFGANSADFSFFMDGGTQSVAKSKDAVYENLTGATDAVKAANPDIVFFQEVDIDGTRSHHVNEEEFIAKALGSYSSTVFAQNYDSPFLFYPFTQPHGANKSGLLTMSKFDISSSLRRSLPIEQGVTSIFDLDRCYSISRIPVKDGHELVVFNLHLSAYTSTGKIAEDQLAMLFADMQKERDAGNWAIAGGDFNKDLLGNSAKVFGVEGEGATWALPFPTALLPSSMKLVTPYDPNNHVATCRNLDRPLDDTVFLVTIDGFIVSDNVKVESSRVIDTGFLYTDHNPVEMKFSLL